MIYISNAFSLQMVPEDCSLDVSGVELHDLKCIVKDNPYVHSIIGHADTANVVSKMLGAKLPANRESIMLMPDDILFVAQVVGGRLPEGATTLPEGVKIVFRRVLVDGREYIN